MRTIDISEWRGEIKIEGAPGQWRIRQLTTGTVSLGRCDGYEIPCENSDDVVMFHRNERPEFLVQAWDSAQKMHDNLSISDSRYPNRSKRTTPLSYEGTDHWHFTILTKGTP